MLDFLLFSFIQLIHQLATSRVYLLNRVGRAYVFNQQQASNAPVFISDHLYTTSTCFDSIYGKKVICGPFVDFHIQP